MSRQLLLILVLGVCLGLAGSAWAAEDTKDLTIYAKVSAKAKLALDPTQITFDVDDADPDTGQPIAADYPVNVTAKFRTTVTAQLTVSANSDLVDGGKSIAIGNVTWESSSPDFATTGTMKKNTAVTVASFNGSGTRTGSLNFFLANKWEYTPGNYTATATYTLTAP